MTESAKEASNARRKEVTCVSLTSVINCFLVTIFVGGLSNMHGLLYTNMMVTLNIEEYPLTWIGSITTGCFGLASIPVALLLDNLGCRKTLALGGLCMSVGLVASSQITNLYLLYFTLGLLPGIGIVIGFIASTVDVRHNFDKLQPIALGIGGSGYGVGNFIWPPLTSSLIEKFGWQGCLLIFGGVLLNIIPFSLIIKKQPDASTRGTNEDKKCANQTIRRSLLIFIAAFKQPGCVAICTSRIFNGAGIYAFATFVPEYAMTSALQLSYTDVSMAVAVTGIGTSLGRLITSSISTVRRSATLPVMILCLALCGVATVLVLVCESFASLLVVGVTYGLAFGGWSCLGATAITDLFEVQHFSKGFSVMICCQGIGSLVGPPLLSYIGAATGQRELIFYTAGLTYLLSCFLCVLTLVRSKPCLKNKTSGLQQGSIQQTEIQVISGERVPDS